MADLPDEAEWEAFDLNMDRQIEATHVNNLLLKLPAATRTVFNLFLWEDLTPSEIAKELSVSIETVRWHIKTARKRMRHQIEKS
jgi:RNA polymerase sigma-70 factor (ECF subfamily)